MISEILALAGLRDGWDGEGGAAPSAAAILDAVRFVRVLGGLGRGIEPTLHADGSVLLEVGGGEAGSFRFGGDGMVSFALQDIGRGTVPVDECALHDGIRRVLWP